MCLLYFLYESSIRNHLRKEISKTNATLHLTDSVPNLICLGHARKLIGCSKQVHLKESIALLDSCTARRQ